MTSKDEQASVDLNQPLPSAVAVGGVRNWLAYRRYPTFSPPWLLRRSLIFFTVIGLIATLGILNHFTQTGDWKAAFVQAGLFTLGFVVISTAGPLLATLARWYAPSSKAEKVLVTTAVLVGLLLAGLADMWSSGQLEKTMDMEREHALGTTALVVNVLVLFGIYSVLGGGIALLSYFGEHRRLREHQTRETIQRLRREKLESDQRLSLLQAQIEPHFLFNTLAAARSLLRESPERAESMLGALSAYLRAAIPRLRQGHMEVQSRLGEQLSICEHYLEVMALRHGRRLRWEVAVPDELKSLPFPPFVLITLVENAVQHGIEPKREGGSVEIRADRSGHELTVTVTDNGAGLAPGMVMGVGLENVREQLETRHGGAARLSLSSVGEGGTRATVVLPVIDDVEALHG